MENKDEDIKERLEVQTPWFKLFVDNIGWRELVAIGMILLSITYIIKG